MYFAITMIIAIVLGINLRKYIKKRKSKPTNPRKSKVKTLGLSIFVLLILGIIVGVADKKNTSMRWTSEVDNLIWNYQYNVSDKTNDISKIVYDKNTDVEYILITNKNSVDKIKIVPLYSNGIPNLDERMAKALKGKVKKKYNGSEIFEIKNDSQTLVYIYPGVCYVEYYKKDGGLEKTYLNVCKSIFGGSL